MFQYQLIIAGGNMVTTQTAFNSFDRVVRYVEQIKDETNLYKKSKEHLANLRDIAVSLIETIDTKIGEVSEVKTPTTDDTKAMMLEILSLLKQDNDTTEQGYVKEIINTKPQVNDTVSNTIVKDYKKAVDQVLEHDDIEFTTNARDCMELFRDYLDVRFNIKNDPNKIHFFDKKQFRNYAAAFIINFANHLENDEVDSLIHYMNTWFEDVKTGTVKYTLPRDIAAIFFEIKNGNDLDISEYVEYISREMWNESWVFGLNSLYENSLYSPDYDMEWLFGSRLGYEFEAKIDVDNFEGVRQKDVDKLKNSWIEYYHISKRNKYMDHITKLRDEYGLEYMNIIPTQLSLNIIANQIFKSGDVKGITKKLNKFNRSCKCNKPNYDEIDSMVIDYLMEYN